MGAAEGNFEVLKPFSEDFDGPFDCRRRGRPVATDSNIGLCQALLDGGDGCNRDRRRRSSCGSGRGSLRQDLFWLA